MDIAEVKAEVRKIRKRSKSDYESAHGLEDDLYQAVLETIASGQCQDPVGLAAEALKTQRIQFKRICA
jgi:hypothetical protein